MFETKLKILELFQISLNIFKKFKIKLTLGSSKLFYSAEAPAPLKWGNFGPSLRINYIS
jgi:hypothetical protein